MKNLILLLLILSGTYGFAQDQNQISVSLGIGQNSMLQDESLSNNTIHGEKFNSIELRYVHNFIKKFNRRKVWALETGIMYAKHEVVISEPANMELENIKIITVPTYIRYTFLKYYYVNGGLLFTMELDSNEHHNRSKQDGMGLGLGVGAEYHFGKNFLAFINPFIRQHNLIQFNALEYHDALTEYGIKFGLAYEF
ncbi:MAG: outer membrane beta-barrel protein [Bacteroidota bacterium]